MLGKSAICHTSSLQTSVHSLNEGKMQEPQNFWTLFKCTLLEYMIFSV
jgi:hypothetical protein